MIKQKLFIISKLIYLWDVVFTFIDNNQLKVWYKMKLYQSTLLTEVNKSVNLSKQEKYEDNEKWEDVK